MNTADLVRTFFCVEPVADGPTILRDFGRSDLCRFFAAARFEHGAEIGVWTGQFSKQLCEAIRDLKLLCVDPWEAYDDYRERKNDTARLESAYEECQSRLTGFPYCSIWRMTSLSAARMRKDQTLDFVYLDGNHDADYVREDLRLWEPKIRPGGILAGHDFQTSPARPWIEVEFAVRQFTRERAISPWFVLARDKSPSYFWVVT